MEYISGKRVSRTFVSQYNSLMWTFISSTKLSVWGRGRRDLLQTFNLRFILILKIKDQYLDGSKQHYCYHLSHHFIFILRILKRIIVSLSIITIAGNFCANNYFTHLLIYTQTKQFTYFLKWNEINNIKNFQLHNVHMHSISKHMHSVYSISKQTKCLLQN